MFGSYPTDLELSAIIRRIDTDGDGSLSFDEFTDFFLSQVNEEAAMLSRSQKPLPPSSQKKGRRIKSAARHRRDLFPTQQQIKVGANLVRLKSAVKPGKIQSAKNSP